MENLQVSHQQPTVAQPISNSHTLSDLQPSELNFSNAKKIISHIREKYGIRSLNPKDVEKIDQDDLTDFSDEDSFAFAIALQLQLQYFQELGKHNPELKTHLTIQKQIQALKSTSIIPSYSSLLIDDKKKNGIYRRMYDNMVKQLEEVER